MNGLVLHNVLVVPKFNHNLLSIHKLANDTGCTVRFTPETCEHVDSTKSAVKTLGKVYNGLYYLIDSDAASSSIVNSLVNCNAAAVDVNLWHLRLGHASVTKMHHISHLKGHVQATGQVCLTCPMSKFQKLPYPVSSSHAKEPFALVHLDTWGPYKVCTRNKFKYFLTLVDDNTRMAWLYLMQHKSDFLTCFKAFFKYVFTKFKKSIQCIRSDNAPEFADASSVIFYNHNGIIHHKSCVNRPQQNARAKRKHRHVLEVARSLKFQSGLSLSYWGDFVLTATYLINRLPTLVLGNKTPYEICIKRKLIMII